MSPDAPAGPELVDALRARTDAMLTDVAELVSVESPSSDDAACRAAIEVAVAVARRTVGDELAAEVVESSGRAHLRLRGPGQPSVLLVGHLDTVWPTGTLARWPFSVDGDRATGPGVFDMKAGVVQGLHALALAGCHGVEVLLTTDEEVGSPTSRAIVEEAARRVGAALVLEPAAGGAVKVARKGVSLYRIEVEGRAAHAGLEPEKGANAVVELAHQVLALEAIARPELGTSVTPTVASAGTTTNTVPAAATVAVDVRAPTAEEQQRVDAAVRALTPTVPGTSVRVVGGGNRPPLPTSASEQLIVVAREVAEALGLPPLAAISVGGGSDGNFTAGVGTPTLDGLGAVGDGAHAEGEHISVAGMAERAALVAAMVQRLRR